jgi:predicted kinase
MSTMSESFKKTFYILYGIPGSGKTEWAQQFISDNPQISVRYVSRDEILLDITKKYNDEQKKVRSKNAQIKKENIHEKVSNVIKNATEDVIIYDSTNATNDQRRYFASLVDPVVYTIVYKYFEYKHRLDDDCIRFLMSRNHPIFPRDFEKAKKLMENVSKYMEN